MNRSSIARSRRNYESVPAENVYDDTIHVLEEEFYVDGLVLASPVPSQGRRTSHDT